MGAEIVWPAELGALRVGALRFGPAFQAYAGRDPYAGCGTVEDHGEVCVIGPLAGEFDAQDWDDILDACAGWGFQRAEFERHGRLYQVDLTVRPFRMRKG